MSVNVRDETRWAPYDDVPSVLVLHRAVAAEIGDPAPGGLPA